MHNLLQDIKNKSFLSMYLLCGEEAYLRKQYRDKLTQALISKEDTMNYHYYEGKDINIPAIIDLAETMPFLADKRVIVIENSNLFKAGGEQLAEYLSAPSESVIFIFVETQIDKRSRLYKSVKSHGRIAEFAIQNETTLKRWIASCLKKEGKVISEKNCELFLDKTGMDMSNIHSELEKLICYSINEYEISSQSIEAISTQSIHNRIFEMIALIAEGQQKKAIDMYHDLLTLKEPPMRILSLIARQFNIMLQVKELQEKKCIRQDIANKIGLPAFIIAKYERQTIRYSIQNLMKAIQKCVIADENVKTGKINDILSIELLIVELSK